MPQRGELRWTFGQNRDLLLVAGRSENVRGSALAEGRLRSNRRARGNHEAGYYDKRQDGPSAKHCPTHKRDHTACNIHVSSLACKPAVRNVTLIPAAEELRFG